MSSVSVFSAPWCAGCKIVKKALTNAGIEFEEVDISTKEGQEMAKNLSIKSIPVTFVFGHSAGFIGSKPETIKDILEAIND